MPYVALEPATRESRMAVAAARWREMLAAHTDLAPAIALQEQLVGVIVDQLEQLERGRPLRLSLPGRYLAAKLSRGVPALAGEQIPVPAASLSPALLHLCEALARGGAGDPADRIGDALKDGSIEPGSLLAASLTRNQTAIRTAATHRGLAPDLLWLIAELAVSPFAYLQQRMLFQPAAPSPSLAEALAAWTHGYCPACGSWPALAEVVKSDRILRCSFCGSGWTLTADACTYCGEGGEALVTTAPEDAGAGQWIDSCGTCGGYLKIVEIAALSPFPLVALTDLETTHLDITAMAGGYRRPELKDFVRSGATG